MKRFADAEALLRHTLTNRQKTEPNSWRPFQTMSQLGASLEGQAKYADAEPMLVGGFEGLMAREKDIPARMRKEVTAAAKRIVSCTKRGAGSTRPPRGAIAWRSSATSLRPHLDPTSLSASFTTQKCRSQMIQWRGRR